MRRNRGGTEPVVGAVEDGQLGRGGRSSGKQHVAGR